MEKSFKILHFCLEKGCGMNIFEPLEPKQKKFHYLKRFIHLFGSAVIFLYSLWDLIYNEDKRFIDRALLVCICPGFVSESTMYVDFLLNLDQFRENIEWIRGRYLRRPIEVVERLSNENFGKYSKILEKTIV